MASFLQFINGGGSPSQSDDLTTIAPAPMQSLSSLPVMPTAPIQPTQAVQPSQDQSQPLQPIFPTPTLSPIRVQREQGLEQSLRSMEAPKAPPSGFWGKTKSILGDIGNAAGEVILGDRNMQDIPGTNSYKMATYRNTANTLGGMQKQDADSMEKGAQTAELQEKTKEMPTELQRQLDQLNAQLAENGLMLDPQTQRIVPVSNDQLSPKLKAELLPKTPDEAFVREHPDATAQQMQDFQKQPLTQQEADSLNGIWNPIATQYHLPTDQFTVGMPHADASTLSGSFNNAIARGQGQEHIVLQSGNDAGVDRLASRLAKPYQTADDKKSDQIDRIDEAVRMLQTPGAEGKALGIPKTLTGLVSGEGTGIRVTQPELQQIYNARGLKGDVEAWFNQISGEGKLSGQQVTELTGILSDARQRLLQKVDINAKALDAINGADNREQIQAADKLARQQTNELEKFGHYTGEQVQLKNGQSITIKEVHPDGSFD